MNGQMPAEPVDLVTKIARLVEERGWNQEDFARQASLNRQTVRQIMQPAGDRRLRNVTISRCARALGLSVNELRNLPVERLLLRLSQHQAEDGDCAQRRLYDLATQPELQAWLACHPEQARQLTADEFDELLSLQGTGGPLTNTGVEHYVALIERKRRLIQQVQVVAGTEYIDLLEQLVGILYDKVQPYRERR